MKDIETEKAMARTWIEVTPETEWPGWRRFALDHTRVLGILYLDYLERKEREGEK